MKKTWALGLGLSMLLGSAPSAFAADHADGTTETGGPIEDPSGDINDAFAWMSSDSTATTGKVNLVMDVFPGATATSKFSTAVKYVFHTQSRAAYGMPATNRDIICTFAGTTTQTASCWITDPGSSNAVVGYLTGDASVKATPLVSADTKIKLFAGVRNDPFFFNLAGFRNATSVVAAALKDAAANAGIGTYIKGIDPTHPGCPILTTAARSTVVGYLSKACDGTGTAKDFFRKPEATPGDCSSTPPALVTTGSPNEPLTGNILAIVLSVDKSLLTSGGPILSVWAATTK